MCTVAKPVSSYCARFPIMSPSKPKHTWLRAGLQVPFLLWGQEELSETRLDVTNRGDFSHGSHVLEEAVVELCCLAGGCVLLLPLLHQSISELMMFQLCRDRVWGGTVPLQHLPRVGYAACE